MTNQEKITFAKTQLAGGRNITIEQFEADETVIVESPYEFFRANTFGKHAVMYADKRILGWLADNFKSTLAQDVFDEDGDNIFLINEKFRTFGQRLSGDSIWYLHLSSAMEAPKPEGFTFKLFEGDSAEALKNILHENGLAEKFNNSVDLGDELMQILAAYADDQIVAIAASDEYLADMWNIGVDTLESHRGHGLASYMVQTLTKEVEAQGKLAIYSTWASNLVSQRIALRAGFSPVWVTYCSEDL